MITTPSHVPLPPAPPKKSLPLMLNPKVPMSKKVDIIRRSITEGYPQYLRMRQAELGMTDYELSPEQKEELRIVSEEIDKSYSPIRKQTRAEHYGSQFVSGVGGKYAPEPGILPGMTVKDEVISSLAHLSGYGVRLGLIQKALSSGKLPSGSKEISGEFKILMDNKEIASEAIKDFLTFGADKALFSVNPKSKDILEAGVIGIGLGKASRIIGGGKSASFIRKSLSPTALGVGIGALQPAKTEEERYQNMAVGGAAFLLNHLIYQIPNVALKLSGWAKAKGLENLTDNEILAKAEELTKGTPESKYVDNFRQGLRLKNEKLKVMNPELRKVDEFKSKEEYQPYKGQPISPVKSATPPPMPAEKPVIEPKPTNFIGEIPPAEQVKPMTTVKGKAEGYYPEDEIMDFMGMSKAGRIIKEQFKLPSLAGKTNKKAQLELESFFQDDISTPEREKAWRKEVPELAKAGVFEQGLKDPTLSLKYKSADVALDKIGVRPLLSKLIDASKEVVSRNVDVLEVTNEIRNRMLRQSEFSKSAKDIKQKYLDDFGLKITDPNLNNDNFKGTDFEKRVFSTYRTIMEEIFVRENELKQSLGEKPLNKIQFYQFWLTNADKLQEIYMGNIPSNDIRREILGEKTIGPHKQRLSTGESRVLDPFITMAARLKYYNDYMFTAEPTKEMLFKYNILRKAGVLSKPIQREIDNVLKYEISREPTPVEEAVDNSINNMLQFFRANPRYRVSREITGELSRRQMKGLFEYNPGLAEQNLTQVFQNWPVIGARNTIKGFFMQSPPELLEILKKDPGYQEQIKSRGLSIYTGGEGELPDFNKGVGQPKLFNASQRKTVKATINGAWLQAQDYIKSGDWTKEQAEKYILGVYNPATISQYDPSVFGRSKILRDPALRFMFKFKSFEWNKFTTYLPELWYRFKTGYTQDGLPLKVGNRIEAGLGLLHEFGAPAVVTGGKTYTGYQIFDKMRAGTMLKEWYKGGVLGSGGEQSKDVYQNLFNLYYSQNDKTREKAFNRLFIDMPLNLLVNYSGIPGALQMKRLGESVLEPNKKDISRMFIHPIFLNK